MRSLGARRRVSSLLMSIVAAVLSAVLVVTVSVSAAGIRGSSSVETVTSSALQSAGGWVLVCGSAVDVTYDQVGNRTVKTDRGGPEVVTTTYEHGAGGAGPHQLTSVTESTGSLSVTTGFTWDGVCREVCV